MQRLRTARGLLCALALCASSTASAAQPNTTPVTVTEVPDRSGASDHPFQLGHIGRPVFFGLMAFSFLAMGAYVSSKERGKAPRSRSFQPPRSTRL